MLYSPFNNLLSVLLKDTALCPRRCSNLWSLRHKFNTLPMRYSAPNYSTVQSLYNTPHYNKDFDVIVRLMLFVCLFLLLYVPSQQLWSWRGGQFTLPHFFLGKLEQAVNQYFVHILSLVCLILYIPSTIFQLNRNESSWVEPVLS